MSDESRLRWQCRRGTQELDRLLLGWFEAAYADADEAQKSAFRELLALPDPDLIGYLLGRQDPQDKELADVVSRIRNRAAARQESA